MEDGTKLYFITEKLTVAMYFNDRQHPYNWCSICLDLCFIIRFVFNLVNFFIPQLAV
jgi:hypothetical protein